LSENGVGHSEIWHFVNDLRSELNIPMKYVIQIRFEDNPKEGGHILIKENKILGSELLFDKKVKVPTDVLYHSLSHAKHYSMGFPHVLAETKIKGYDWFLYYTLNEYNTNLIELLHFKNHFINFLKKHKMIVYGLSKKSEKSFVKSFSKLSEQLKVEIMSDMYRFKILCDDLDLGSAPYDFCLRALKKEYYRVLGYDFVKEGKKLYEEEIPPLPEDRYSAKDVEKILNFFDKKKRGKLKVFFWD